MIYIQSYNKHPLWDFGSSALHACMNQGFDYKLTENIPPSDGHSLIGSVEWCTKWLSENGHEVPRAIDIFKFEDFLHRKCEVISTERFLKENTIWPIFIKPFSDIKAFTGTQVLNLFDAQCVLQDYTGDLLVQEVVDSILSEWRVYVNRGKIVGCKSYKGLDLIFPNKKFIETTVNHALTILDNVSFTLDFAVIGIKRHQLPKDKIWHDTILIEPNDGWAIGNYGLEPEDYLRFCTDRWMQLIKK